MIEGFDYIIIGAGSAGCVLAARLSEDPDCRVLLLEAGKWDRDPLVHIPLGWGLLFKQRRHDWGYDCVPEETVKGRAVECVRGKLVGGCSSTNAMAWVRGSDTVYDRWASEKGMDDWGLDAVLPYFKKQENWEGGDSERRGASGPINVQRCRFEDPLVDAVGEAGRETFGWTDDYNGANSEGFSRLQMSISKGIRASASNGYLRPVASRSNLTIRTGAEVQELVFEGDRVSGVRVKAKSGTQNIRAEREVLVAAGVINSPKLLKISGIGPERELRHHGIEVRNPLSGVGANLMDHPSVIAMYHRNEQGPFHRMMRYDRIGFDVVRTYLGGEGFSGDVPGGITAFLRSSKAVDMPDLQLLFTAAPLASWPYLSPFRKPFTDGYAMRMVLTRPKSRGEVTLTSADPSAPPRILQNFLADAQDLQVLKEGLEIARSIGESPHISPFAKAETAPGPLCTSDEMLSEFIRNTLITVHHPCGTCRMGDVSDKRTVVGPDLKVHGTNGLRVVDASVFPEIPNGNINAAVIMVAERAVDYIRKG